MTVPYCWKIEFHAIGYDGSTLDWCDSLEDAKSVKGCVKVELVKSYVDDRDLVWALDDEELDDEELDDEELDEEE